LAILAAVSSHFRSHNGEIWRFRATLKATLLYL